MTFNASTEVYHLKRFQHCNFCAELEASLNFQPWNFRTTKQPPTPRRKIYSSQMVEKGGQWNVAPGPSSG